MSQKLVLGSSNKPRWLCHRVEAVKRHGVVMVVLVVVDDVHGMDMCVSAWACNDSTHCMCMCMCMCEGGVGNKETY